MEDVGAGEAVPGLIKRDGDAAEKEHHALMLECFGSACNLLVARPPAGHACARPAAIELLRADYAILLAADGRGDFAGLRKGGEQILLGHVS